MVLLVAFGRYFAVTVNVSDSLKGNLFLIQKGGKPQIGDLAAFFYGGGGPHRSGTWFLKEVAGDSGSSVLAIAHKTGGLDYFVDGEYVGRAKLLSKTGMPLKPGPTGNIPPGHFYMSAPHPDSLDSRYALVGWVPEEKIIGRAFKVF